MISRGLALLAANTGGMLAVSVIVGILVPSLSSALRPLLAGAVACVLFLALLRLDWGRLSGACSRPAPLIVGVLWLMVGAPTVVLVFARGLGLDPAMTAALALAASAPPLMASPALALLLGLDAVLCVALLLLATLATPFTITFVSAEFLSLGQGFGPLDLLMPLALLVAGTAGAACLVQQILGKVRLAAASPSIGGLSVLALMVLSMASMDGVLARFHADPHVVLQLLLAAFMLNVVLQGLTGLIFGGAGRLRALTMAFCGGNRNVLLLLTIVPAQAHPDIALFFALAQVPMYLLPVLLRPLYHHVLQVPAIPAHPTPSLRPLAAARSERSYAGEASALTTLGVVAAGAPSIDPLSAETY